MTSRIITGPEAEAVKQPQQSPHLAELLNGAVIHFDDLRQHFNASQLKQTYRVRLRTRLDGEGGRYYWVEQLG